MKKNLTDLKDVAHEINHLIDTNEKVFMQFYQKIEAARVDTEAALESLIRTRNKMEEITPSEFDGMSTIARYQAVEHTSVLERVMGPRFCATINLCATHGIPLVSMLEMYASYAHDESAGPLREIMNNSDCGGFNHGNAYASFFPMYLEYGEYAPIHFDSSLMSELQMTDISSNVPSNMLELPFDHIYLQFGPTGKNSVLEDEYVVHNNETGDHKLESVLISFHNSQYRAYNDEAKEALGFTDGSDVRSFDVMFIGSPKASMMDDATHHMTVFYDHNSDEPLLDVLDKALDYHINHQQFPNPNFKRMVQKDAENMRRNISLLARCLIYLNCGDARQIQVDEKTAIKSSLNSVKNPKKRRKLQKELLKADKYVLVTSQRPVYNKNATSEPLNKKRMHWRRGHMRLQRHGEQLSKTKLVYIKPSLIGTTNKHKTPSKPTYIVKH